MNSVIARLLRPTRPFVLITLALLVVAPAIYADDAAVDHFEKRIRPLLLQRCVKCHSGEEPKGSLRFEGTTELKGASGPVVVAGKPDESLLIRAIRQTEGLKMPPGGKLSDGQIADLVTWVQQGAYWPSSAPAKNTADSLAAAGEVAPLEPNAAAIASDLQLWLSAADLQLADGDKVFGCLRDQRNSQ
ncbi:MAG: hypothetical protein NT069_19200 [Planctomycetota bacterium]|nr:hypothetical protein [Planctomycetota bacterium]